MLKKYEMLSEKNKKIIDDVLKYYRKKVKYDWKKIYETAKVKKMSSKKIYEKISSKGEEYNEETFKSAWQRQSNGSYFFQEILEVLELTEKDVELFSEEEKSKVYVNLCDKEREFLDVLLEVLLRLQ